MKRVLEGSPRINTSDESAPSGGSPTPMSEPGLAPPQPPEESSDPFDPARLRLSQDFAAAVAVTKAIVSIPVRRPDKQWFLRVHPSPDFTIDTNVIEIRDDNETYIVIPEIALAIPDEVIPKRLHTVINRQGVLGLWPIRLPGEDGRLDPWNRSAHTIAEMATAKWVRVVSNRSLGAYEPLLAGVDLPEPEWPPLSFAEILRIAFKDRIIENTDHPVLARLRGEI